MAAQAALLEAVRQRLLGEARRGEGGQQLGVDEAVDQARRRGEEADAPVRHQDLREARDVDGALERVERGHDVVEQRVVREVRELAIERVVETVVRGDPEPIEEAPVHGVPERPGALRRRGPQVARGGGRREPVDEQVQLLVHGLVRDFEALAPHDPSEQVGERRVRVHERLPGIEEHGPIAHVRDDSRGDRSARVGPDPAAGVIRLGFDGGARPEFVPEPVDLRLELVQGSVVVEHHVGLRGLVLERQLHREAAPDVVLLETPPLDHPPDLELLGSGHDHEQVDVVVLAHLDQQRRIDHHHAIGVAVGRRALLDPLADDRVHDRLELAQPRRIGEDDAGERRTDEPAVGGDRLGEPFARDRVPARPGRERLPRERVGVEDHGPTGGEHRGHGRLPRSDPAGESDEQHAAPGPASRSGLRAA